MPLCGFNKKMLEGLAAFQEGLVEHGLLERARKKGQKPEEVLERELGDMERFLVETPRMQDPEIRELTEYLARYAVAFYKLVRRDGVTNYKGLARGVSDFCAKMDDKFSSDLEGKEGDMRKLVDYLNTLRI